MSEFSGFTENQEKILKEDIEKAKHLAQKCNDSLLISPDGLKNEIKELLVDTFSIVGDDRDQVNAIRSKYLSFSNRIDNSNFHSVPDKNVPKEAGSLAAFVKSNNSKDVFIVTPKFFTNSDKERTVVLIHEYIHLLDPNGGHPGFEGRIKIIFEREKLDIPYEKALLNAYCYHYYAAWLPS